MDYKFDQNNKSVLCKFSGNWDVFKAKEIFESLGEIGVRNKTSSILLDWENITPPDLILYKYLTCDCLIESLGQNHKVAILIKNKDECFLYNRTFLNLGYNNLRTFETSTKANIWLEDPATGFVKKDKKRTYVVPVWNSIYNIGIEKIDYQHRCFLELIGEINDLHKSNSDSSAVSSSLQELILYAKFHFRSEEALMRKINYPGIANHLIDHKTIMDELILAEKIYNKGLVRLEAILEFLLQWFLEHTSKTDKKVYYFLQTYRS